MTPPRRRRAGRLPFPSLLREARANVGSGGATVALIRLSVLLSTATLCWWSVVVADGALDDRADLDRAGRQTLRVSAPRSTDGVPAAFCDALRAVDGVVAAGGYRPLAPLQLSTGQRVTAHEVTPGFIATVAPEAGTRSGDGVAVGGLLAEELGLARGGHVQVASGSAGALPVVALPRSPRTGAIDDSVLFVVAPIGDVRECVVEPDHAHRGAVIQAISAMAPRSRPVVVLAFDAALERDTGPERRLRDVPGDPLTLLSGAFLAALAGGWWHARRQELTLYRAFGVTAGTLTRLLVLEWGALVLVPALAGAAWGTWATASRDPRPLALGIGMANAAAAVTLSLIAVALARSTQLRADASLVLRGA